MALVVYAALAEVYCAEDLLTTLGCLLCAGMSLSVGLWA